MKRLILIPFLLTACAHANHQSATVANDANAASSRMPAATGDCAEAERVDGWNTAITEDQNGRPLYNHLLEYAVTGRITNVVNDANSACTVYTMNVAKGGGGSGGKANPEGNFASPLRLRVIVTAKNENLFSGINFEQDVEIRTLNHYHDDMSLEVSQRSPKHSPR